VYWYGTYLYLTYFWPTSHLFPCVPLFPHPPILQSVMFSHVIVYKLTITTITSSFTSCDATPWLLVLPWNKRLHRVGIMELVHMHEGLVRFPAEGCVVVQPSYPLCYAQPSLQACGYRTGMTVRQGKTYELHFQEHDTGRSLYPADKVSIAIPSRSV